MTLRQCENLIRFSRFPFSCYPAAETAGNSKFKYGEFNRRRFNTLVTAGTLGSFLALMFANEAEAYRGPIVWTEGCVYPKYGNAGTMFELHTRFYTL